jgi:hypothetical protein
MKRRDTIAIALLFTTGLAAQSSITETKEKTRIAVKGSRPRAINPFRKSR